MADNLTAREMEELFRRYFGEGGGARRGGAAGVGANAGDRLNDTLEQTDSSLKNYLSVQKEYTKRHQAGSFVAGLFCKKK